MYEIAAQVAQWQAAGLPVTLARVIEIRGISSRERSHVAAGVPGEPPVGSVLSGAADAQVAQLLAGDPGVHEVRVGDAEAAGAGLACGGTARVLVQRAADLPLELWSRLIAREPVCLVTALDGDRVGATALYTAPEAASAGAQAARLFARGATQTALVESSVVTVLWPVPALVVVGDGLIAEALVATAGLLGWQPAVVNDAQAAITAITGLSAADGVVVLSHNRDVDGPALAAALAGRAGYVGALGSRHTQAARAEWLAEQGVTDLSRVHGPAGLDIGAYTPAEIALAIAAEMLAARSGASAGSLRDRGGPVHPGGVNAPPPRYPS